MTALLEARCVTKVFGGGLFDRNRTVALEDFSLAIEYKPVSITAVIGESGSGKTTLARLLLGILTPTQGEVLFRGTDLRSLSRSDWRTFRREVQVIFQDPYEVYNPFYRVDHVLTTPVAKFHLASSKDEARYLIENTLRSVGLRPEETLGRFPHQLSGGQRQRVMVARAFLLRPRLILADEPVSMVDASLRATVLGTLLQLNQQFGISIIYITHDIATAYQISKNTIVLYRGSVVEAGDIDLIVMQPQHPYTRLLIESMPVADLEHTWSAVGSAVALDNTAAGGIGCKFASRCPSVQLSCRKAAPPLYRTGHDRVTACYLYQDASPMSAKDLGEVFVKSGIESPAVSSEL